MCGCELWVRVYLVCMVIDCHQCVVLSIVYYQDVVDVSCVKDDGFCV